MACVSTVPLVHAAFIPIAQPVAAYTSGTTLLPLPAATCSNLGTPADPCPANTVNQPLTVGTFTVSFSSPDSGNLVISRAAVPVGWSTWNVPPAVESNTPRVLQDEVNLTCPLCTLLLSFNSPVQTFGFEAEPDPFGVAHTISATFLNGASTVGTITIPFSTGNSSARWFAATTTGSDQFTSVRVTIDGADFAFAQLRFGAQI